MVVGLQFGFDEVNRNLSEFAFDEVLASDFVGKRRVIYVQNLGEHFEGDFIVVSPQHEFNHSYEHGV